MQLDILDLSIAQLLDDVHGTGANESERRAVRYTYTASETGMSLITNTIT